MILLEGKISVKSALLNNKRDVYTIFVDETKNDKDTHFILQKAAEKEIEVRYLPRASLDTLATGKTHGGILAYAGNRKSDNLESILSNSNCPFLVLLEGIEDPYNLGYILRSLACCGCNGLILKKRDWETGESVIMKASAGAYDAIPVIFGNTSEAVSYCKQHGLRIVAAVRKQAVSLYEANLQVPLLMCIGGEMRGLSSRVLSEVQQNIFIPYEGSFRNALNAASATSVIAFEILRQRKYKKV